MTESQRLSVGNVTLNYRLDGHGPRPLVCIHGVGSSLEAWAEVVDALKDDFSVLTFDLRGHGQSSRTPGRYEIDHLVSETLALAEHVGFASFDLAGFSLGGLIAQRLAITRPERVRRLVLLSTVAGRTAQERERVNARLVALQSGEPVAHYEASLARWLTEGFQAAHPQTVQRLRQLNAANDPSCYAAAYRVLAESDFGEQLGQIQCPTLIATGADDLGSNPRMAAFMHEQIRGSRMQILPGLRHCILIEAPQQVAALMRDFLIESQARHG